MRALAVITLALSSIIVDARAMSLQLGHMDGGCKPNSQLTYLSKAQLEANVKTPQRYSCNKALITEFENGRVVINVSDTLNKKAWAVGYSGQYVENAGVKKSYLEVDGMYFIEPGTKSENVKFPAKGHCEIEYSKGKVTNLACLSATEQDNGALVIASAVFEVSSYRKETIAGPTSPRASSPQSAPQHTTNAWYGVADSGAKCSPTDMSPAERIDWLRARGIKYDAIDYSGPMVGGRVPKVTIIPRNGSYPSWVYYATKEFCEEKEVSTSKYR